MRLVTRGDLDGLACAVLIHMNEEIEETKLIHPQDITNGRVEITSRDVLANVPYHPNCAMWFDHHLHTATYRERPKEFKGVFGEAPSAARLVYDYYGGKDKMPELEELIHETDRLDAANLTPEDITDPKGYILLGFTIDSRTGLGAFQSYFMTLVEQIRCNTPVSEILAHPQVKRRVDRMRLDDDAFRRATLAHSRVDGNIVVTDFRPLETIPSGNRFLVYALYPEVNVSLRIHWGPGKHFVVSVLGHSIFNRSCQSNIGELAARYGGGGHRGAGSIPLPAENADEKLSELITELKRNG